MTMSWYVQEFVECSKTMSDVQVIGQAESGEEAIISGASTSPECGTCWMSTCQALAG